MLMLKWLWVTLISSLLLGDDNMFANANTITTRRNGREFTCSGRYLGKPYCQYTEGDCQSRLVINAPHGGQLKPPDVPARAGGCLVKGKCDWTYVL